MTYGNDRVFPGFQSVNPFWLHSPYHPGISPYYPQAIPQRMNWIHTNPIAAAMTDERIRHIVLFALRPEIGEAEAGAFLAYTRQVLASIPGAQKAAVFCQINPQNDYPFGVTLEFADPAVYEAFKTDPIHLKFVEELWNKKVERYFIAALKAC